MDNANESLEEEIVESPVDFVLYLRDGGRISCRAGREVYESLFGAQLEYLPRTVHNLNRGDYTVWEWVEKAPASVPEGLGGYFIDVGLEKMIYLTD
jgi:hypothetical protein